MGPKGISTAAGLYQITRSTWDPIARNMGISDFSEGSQTRVAEELYRTRGFQPWAPHNPALRAAIGDGGGGGAAAMQSSLNRNEVAFWERQKATATAGSAEMAEIEQELNQARIKVAKEGAAAADRAGREATAAAEKAAREQERIAKQTLTRAEQDFARTQQADRARMTGIGTREQAAVTAGLQTPAQAAANEAAAYDAMLVKQREAVQQNIALAETLGQTEENAEKFKDQLASHRP